jgi:phenylacetate-CoA ligase
VSAPTGFDAGLTEAQRRPLIDDDGRRLLEALLEHDHAPRYNHTCGDRLTVAGLAEVRDLDARTRATTGFRPNEPPSWVTPFVTRALATVPAYRRLGPVPARLEDVPTTGRAELIADPYSFVPDDHPLDDLVVFTTTGTTDGRLAYIPSTPVATAAYAVMLRAALRLHGLTLDGGPGRTAVAQICWQRSTYTYASVSTFLDQAALVKLNLNPAEWRRPDDEVAFLDAIDPEVLTGDPVAFARLADLPVTIRPKALLSTAMALLPGLRDTLQERFGCPAIDVYGMNEAGPVAAALPDGSGHALLQPELYVEILDPDGRPCPPGERGEITLTGGFNSAFPLLRYRTGDHAALEARGTLPVLVGLEGRAPVPLQSADGRAVNTIDVTVALRRLPLARFTVHQRADRCLEVGLDPGGAGANPAPGLVADVEAALADLFGPVPVTVSALAGAPERVTYSSALAPT